MKQRTEAIRTNAFYNEAEKNYLYAMDEKKVLDNNMTEKFWIEITNEIKDGEIVIININAKTRLGKSTLAIHIAQIGFNIMEELGQTHPGTKFTIKNIARDQQEFSEIMKEPDTDHTWIVIDEWNDLETGGENSTVERDLLAVFSKVQADRYVNRVWCSPGDQGDPVADIQLQIVGVDKQKKRTRCNLYYKFLRGGTTLMQPLGYVDFYLGDMLKGWETIKDIFYKRDKTPEDERIIEEMAKKDMYVQYILQKRQKIELITKENVQRWRSLRYSKIILEVVRELEPLTTDYKTVTQTMIKGLVKARFKQYGQFQSLVGEKVASDDAEGILDPCKQFYRLKAERRALIAKRHKLEPKDYEQKLKAKEAGIILLKKQIDYSIGELERYVKILEGYEK